MSESIERFSRLEESFHRLRQVDRGDRDGALAALRAEDPSLAEEVIAMLEAHDVERPLIEATIVVDAMRAMASDPSDAGSGERTRGFVGRSGILRFAHQQHGMPRAIGDYRILRLVGEGGMGVVYEAEQRSPKRRVALKIVRGDLLLGPSREERIRRFEREVEALGRLEHPNIARVHDAGEAFVDGDRSRPPVPFVAMEFVDGSPLLAYARTKRLDARASIELMAQLCDGVAAAHAAGVVHRDLKPANILVTATGVPKVLDFGIARFVGEEQATRTLRTGEGELLGTIPYMSPEQIAGDSQAISAASDVYAIGVTLYELLVGRLPLEVRSVSLAEAARIIREERPTRLGEVETSLRGDLETIVAKLLEKEPGRRYQSAGEVADDLRRWLRHEPIRARPASALYRARTFARRHRALVLSTVAIIVLLVASSAALSIVLFKEREQRARAEAANEQLAREAYHATLAAARASISAGEFIVAARELALAQPERRGFEWRLLDRMLAPVERSFAVLDGPIAAVAIPDAGSRLIAIDELGQGVVIDRSDGAVLWRFPTVPGTTKQVATDRIGHRFVVRTTGSVVAYEVGKGELFRATHDLTLTDAAISADGETLVATDLGGGRLHRIAMADGTPLAPPRDDRIYLHAWFDERDRIIVADRSRAETSPLDGEGAWRIPGSFRGMSTSRRTGMLVRDDELRVIDVERGLVTSALRGPFGRDVGFALDRTGMLLSVARPSDVTEIVRMTPDAERESSDRWPGVATNSIGRVWGRAASFDPDRDVLWTGAGDGTIRAWRPGEPGIWSLSMPRSFTGRFDPSGTRLAAAHWGTLMVLDAASGAVESVTLLHRPEILTVAWDASGERIATADERGGVRVVDRASGALLAAFQCGRTRLTQLGWTHDDRIIATDGRRVGVATSYESEVIPRSVELQAQSDPLRPSSIVALTPSDAAALIGPIVVSRDRRGTAIGASGGTILWRDARGGRVVCVQPPSDRPSEAIDWILIDEARERLIAGAGRSLLHWSLAAITAKAAGASGAEADPVVGAVQPASLLRSRVGVLSPDGSRIAIADRSGSVQFFDAERLEPVLGIEVPALDADDAAWRDAESLVLTGGTTLLAALEASARVGASAEASESRSARLRRSRSMEWVEGLFVDERLVERVVERIERAAAEGAMPVGADVEESKRYAALRGSDANLLNSEAWKLARHAEGRLGMPTESDRARAAQAVAFARAADRAIPNDHAILNTLAIALIRARELDDALSALDACDALAIAAGGRRDPFDVLFRAMVHALRDDPREAERLLQEADALVAGRSASELASIIVEVRERIAGSAG